MGRDELSTAQALGQALLARNWYCAVAESCTGGRLAAAITEIPGSSKWFDRGFVTYTNQSKMEMLKVPKEIIDTKGAVSEEVVRYMAEGALSLSNGHIAVAISGIAGPDGGSIEKPVGLVWFSWAQLGKSTETKRYYLEGSRQEVRAQAVVIALEGLLSQCSLS